MPCEDCEYWDAREFPPEKGSVQLGACRHLSPRVVLGASKYTMYAGACPPGTESDDTVEYEHALNAIWPVTRNWDWCGEHQPAEEDSE